MDLGKIQTGVNVVGQLADIYAGLKGKSASGLPRVQPVGFQYADNYTDIPFDADILDGLIASGINAITGKKRRPRRRRLLTATDLNDLAMLKTLTGNSDAFKAAVVRAIRR